jgi:tetratricopeptide (TPR) repeat protein/SAM-dependent methyltransferase
MNRSERRGTQQAVREQSSGLLATAVNLHRAGAFAQAESHYRAVLAKEPDRVECLRNFGILAIQTNRNALAVELIGRALAIDPDSADAHYNFAYALEGCGRLADAIEQYRAALALDPNYSAAHMNLGNAMAKQGRADEAIGCYQRVLAIEPGSAVAHYNIANLLAQQQRLVEAEASYRAAIGCNASFAEAYNNLGNVLKDQGRPGDAESAFARALALKPAYPEAHNNLGIMKSSGSASADALAHFQEAVRLAPRFLEARRNLGLALSRAAQPEAAIREFTATLALHPGDLDATHHLARELLAVGAAEDAAKLLTGALDRGTAETRSLIALCLQSIPAERLEPLRPYVLRALTEGWARGGELERVGIALVKRTVRFAECLPKLSGAAGSTLSAAELAALDRDPLLRPMMTSGRASDSEVERVLTAARRTMLGSIAENPDSIPLDFFCALARQCFINEYVFSETPEEETEVQRLRAAVSDRLHSSDQIPALWPVALGAYLPLHRLPDAFRLLERTWPSPVDELLTQQVREPREEHEIKAALPAITEIDADSRNVQEQYEENPYPRWITPPPLLKPLGVNDFMRAKFPRAPFRPLSTAGGADVLVAGCGSGSHAIEAYQRFADARVLAIDLSRASLAYGVRKTRALGLPIEYGQADILKLGSLERRFDVIESAGALQCLKDPAVGWRILISLLKPGGVMLIGLYSKVARADINAARAYVAAHARGGSAAEIRRCRQQIMALPDGALGKSVVTAGDFYSTSDCRDLLFHVQEYQHTLPEIAGFIAAENLTFLGFQLHPRVLLGYAAAHPDDPAMTDLARWDAFEAAHPEVFASMYQFAVQKT